MGLDAIIALVGALAAAGTAVASNVAADDAADEQREYNKSEAKKKRDREITQAVFTRLKGSPSEVLGPVGAYKHTVADADRIESNANWANIVPALTGGASALARGFTSAPTSTPPLPTGGKLTQAPNVGSGPALSGNPAQDAHAQSVFENLKKYGQLMGRTPFAY